MKNTWLRGNVSLDYNAINTSNILDIHRFLVKET